MVKIVVIRCPFNLKCVDVAGRPCAWLSYSERWRLPDAV